MTDDRPFSLPPSFRFGVATAGFAVEGGYNGPGEPANRWVHWEADGRVERSGSALDFWRRYEEHLDRAAALGCDSFRLSVEWARCEPAPGEVDTAALDRYATILGACRDRELEPVVTLLHFATPAWLGDDPWLDGESPERFAMWAATAVGHLSRYCRDWVTINEPNVDALRTYVLGTFPPGRVLSVGDLVRSIDHLLAAHVLAYDEIKRRQPDSTVSTTNRALSIYELDRLATDVLRCRQAGVTRDDLGPWLAGRRDAFHEAVGDLGRPERVLRRLARTMVPLELALPRAVGAVYGSPHDCTLDGADVTLGDPVASRHLRVPRPGLGREGRVVEPLRAPWDEALEPDRLGHFLELNAASGQRVRVLANGMASRSAHGRRFPRRDGWNRPRYLRSVIAALVVDAIDAGVPVAGFWHWSLADAYQWGSYEPRYGLHGVDRGQGLGWQATDAMGHDAAGTYRSIIDGLRAGDRSVVGR